jgi:peptidoglycan-associated lipoprotein
MARHRAIQFVVILAAAAAVGCGKRISPAVPSPAGPAVANALPASSTADPERNAWVPPTPATDTTLTEDQLFARKTLEELNAEGPLKTVHFALDSSVLDDEARTILQSNAEWLTRWSTTQVLINGHTDERATAEYNLALGDRRAMVVKEYLTSLGVSPKRMAPVSKGEETPVCSDRTESCWWQNRRGMFVISAK